MGFSGTADRTAIFPVGSNPAVFSKDGLALFNLTAHELQELYYDRPILLREALDRLVFV